MSITRRRVEAAGRVVSQVATREQLAAQARNVKDQAERRERGREAEALRVRQGLEEWLKKWKPVWEGQRHHG